MIEINKYSKVINGNDVLKDISLIIKDGEIYGLSGENGSGKTMLMRAICGLIHGDSGFVSVDGKQIGKDIDFPDSIGVLIEGPSFLPELTAVKNLELLGSIRKIASKDKIQRYLNAVGLDPSSKKRYKKFSLGMKQKLGIAAAFFEESRIIILDEPYNAIDEAGIILVNKLIQEAKERGATIILSCHNKELLEGMCDKICHIRNGKIEE